MTINRLITAFNKTVRASRDVKYLIIHYVGATGSAEANCKYYASKKLSSSAHYFVCHSGDIWQSVDDKDIAWHCGTSGTYKHKYARNSNSIGIELCCRKDPWRFEQETIDTAIQLVKGLMKAYNIPIENVIRHYDVTGKNCPAPFVGDTSAWNAFKARLVGATPQPTIPTSTTEKEWCKRLQSELNKNYGANLVVDGIFGSKTNNACTLVKNGSKGELVYLVQEKLSKANCFENGKIDGIFGSHTQRMVKGFQAYYKLTKDGIVGKNTWKYLAKV